MSKDWRQFLDQVRAAGGEVTLRRAGHYMIRGPRGVVFTSASPGDRRTQLNTVSCLRAIGIDVRRSR